MYILIIEILKVVEKCKIYQLEKGPREAWGWASDQKKFARLAGIYQILKICPGGAGGMTTLGIH